jgi:hypothetical protein
MAAVASALAGLGLGGCAATAIRATAEAPFRQRVDSSARGSLLGPFDGAVVEAVSGRPLPGALVYVAWSFERGEGIYRPAGGVVWVGRTDRSGRYRSGALTASVDPMGRGWLRRGAEARRAVRVELLVYQPGYVAYRNDRALDGSRSGDFVQHEHVVRLERAKPTLSHSRHLSFVGNAPQVWSVARREASDASRELLASIERRLQAQGRLPALPESGALSGPDRSDQAAYETAVDTLLSSDGIRAVTGYFGSFEIGPLPDPPLPPEPGSPRFYATRHFKAAGQPESFDVALRVWRLTPTRAVEQYEALLQTLPNAEEKNQLGTRSLEASEGEIVGVALVDEPLGVVVQMSCGTRQCSDPAQLSTLARVVAGRLHRLVEPRRAPPTPPPRPPVGGPAELPKQPPSP